MPRDEESIGIWQAQFEVVGIAADVGERIFAYPKANNWWGPAGHTGPCGPNTEMFYDTGRAHDTSFGTVCHPNCDCGRFVEIWNNVFMVYEKRSDETFVPLAQKNVDTGLGLERVAALLQGVPTVFDIREMKVIAEAIEQLAAKEQQGIRTSAHATSTRIIIDHVRAATFIIGDKRGVVPSNVGQGYIVRRLIRRAVREGRRLGIREPFLAKLADVVIGEFGTHYTELEANRTRIVTEIDREEEKFSRTIEKGLKEFEKMMNDRVITGTEAFILFSTYGFPLELTQELVGEKNGNLDLEEFRREFEKHQELSRNAARGTFAGGLADHSTETTRLHTATHLLHRALKNVLGDHVEQKGSNITAERLRFDFSHGKKMTPDEIQKVEEMVNDAIRRDLPVSCDVMTLKEAKACGALGYFEDTYAQLGGRIKVYSVGDGEKGYYSKEICGGPHVSHTGELGFFKIQKEEAVSAGVRRLKATVIGLIS